MAGDPWRAPTAGLHSPALRELGRELRAVAEAYNCRTTWTGSWCGQQTSVEIGRRFHCGVLLIGGIVVA